MFSITDVLSILAVVALLLLGAVLLGGFLVYKAKTAVPGQPLIGPVPKGEVFVAKDLDLEGLAESPETESQVAAKNRLFKAILGE